MAAQEDDDSRINDGITFVAQTGPAWAGTERDYTYDEVLLQASSLAFLWGKMAPGNQWLLQYFCSVRTFVEWQE